MHLKPISRKLRGELYGRSGNRGGGRDDRDRNEVDLKVCIQELVIKSIEMLYSRMRLIRREGEEEVEAGKESVEEVVIEVEKREEIEVIETGAEDIDIEEYSICLPN